MAEGQQMTSGRDIYASANLLIERYGNDGALELCHKRMIGYVDEGDYDGAAIWKGIKTAVEHLLAGAPGHDEVIN
jgi:hypothetical protein